MESELATQTICLYKVNFYFHVVHVGSWFLHWYLPPYLGRILRSFRVVRISKQAPLYIAPESGLD